MCVFKQIIAQDKRSHPISCVEGCNREMYKVQSFLFMLVSHTKLAPDRFFRLFKRHYRHCNVCTLDDVCCAVLSSTVTGHNKVLLTVQYGKRLVYWDAWAVFFSSVFRHLPNITTYHHFQADSTKPGCIFVKEPCDSPEVEFRMIKQGFFVTVYLSFHPRFNHRALIQLGNGTCTKTFVPFMPVT